MSRENFRLCYLLDTTRMINKNKKQKQIISTHHKIIHVSYVPSTRPSRANIKLSISEIKADIKEIKNDYVIRREFNEALVAVRDDLAFFQKLVYSVFSVMGLAIVGAIFKLIFK